MLAQFDEIKKVSGAIRQMIDQHGGPEAARRATRRERFRIWFTVGLIATAALAALSAWRRARSVARPVEELKKAAAAIGVGKLNQAVPVAAHDGSAN